jgi:hypothetical protein
LTNVKEFEKKLSIMSNYTLSKKRILSLIVCSFLISREESVCWAAAHEDSFEGFEPGRVAFEPRLPPAIRFKLSVKSNQAAFEGNPPQVVKHRQPGVKWKDVEDQKLIELHGLLGNKWKKISQAMNEAGFHRTNNQCKIRWENTLNPDISHEEWADAEDQKLIELHGLLGNKWKKISQAMNEAGFHRTDNQCRTRWGTLQNKNDA